MSAKGTERKQPAIRRAKTASGKRRGSASEKGKKGVRPLSRKAFSDKSKLSIEERARRIREASTFEEWLEASIGACPDIMSGDEVMRKVRDGED